VDPSVSLPSDAVCEPHPDGLPLGFHDFLEQGLRNAIHEYDVALVEAEGCGSSGAAVAEAVGPDSDASSDLSSVKDGMEEEAGTVANEPVGHGPGDVEMTDANISPSDNSEGDAARAMSGIEEGVAPVAEECIVGAVGATTAGAVGSNVNPFDDSEGGTARAMSDIEEGVTPIAEGCIVGEVGVATAGAVETAMHQPGGVKAGESDVEKPAMRESGGVEMGSGDVEMGSGDLEVGVRQRSSQVELVSANVTVTLKADKQEEKAGPTHLSSPDLVTAEQKVCAVAKPDDVERGAGERDVTGRDDELLKVGTSDDKLEKKIGKITQKCHWNTLLMAPAVRAMSNPKATAKKAAGTRRAPKKKWTPEELADMEGAVDIYVLGINLIAWSLK
jgi:hypothetical protein